MEKKPLSPQDRQKRDLSFRPITEGLGFHPFSDGLPYAPVVKTAAKPSAPKSFNAGSGAVSAGIATPVVRSPRVSVPVAQNPIERPRPQSSVQKTLENLVPKTVAQFEPEYGYGYLAARVVAYIFDSMLNISLCATSLAIAMWRINLSPESLMNPGIVLVAALFLIVFNWALITAQEVAFGTSAGKRVFGLVLEGGAIAIFLRAFFFLPSVGFGGIGLLWALFDRRKRCWHDVAVDLQPIKITRL